MIKAISRMTSSHPVSGVSVYVLRERLHESWEKRESLRNQEEALLQEVLTEKTKAAWGDDAYVKAFENIIEGTEGFDNLQSWRSRFLQRA